MTLHRGKPELELPAASHRVPIGPDITAAPQWLIPLLNFEFGGKACTSLLILGLL